MLLQEWRRQLIIFISLKSYEPIALFPQSNSEAVPEFKVHLFCTKLIERESLMGSTCQGMSLVLKTGSTRCNPDFSSEKHLHTVRPEFPSCQHNCTSLITFHSRHPDRKIAEKCYSTKIFFLSN